MDLPEGWKNEKNKHIVWKLKRALYGLHQSGRQWYKKLDQTLVKLGFIKMQGFSCVYTFEKNVVLLIYVDDIAVFYRDLKSKQSVFEKLSEFFDLVDLGEIKNFLGVQFERRLGKIFMHQKSYVKSLIERHKLSVPNRNHVPMPVGTTVQASKQGEKSDIDYPYRSIIGQLLFLASRSRPDIQFATILLSQYNNSFNYDHINLIEGLLNYVANTWHYEVCLSECSDESIVTYSDASWGLDRDTRRSFSGYITFLGGVPLNWGCHKQTSVALSTMEAEFMALTDAVRDANWFDMLLRRSGVCDKEISRPVVFTDNISAKSFSENEIENTRSKHIDIKYHFIREWLNEKKLIKLDKVKTDFNVADIFTKPLSSDRIRYLCSDVFSNISK
jgi:hypothetical protein